MEAKPVYPPPDVSTTATNDALECKNAMVEKLLTDLSKQSDIVIDFSSLKTCLNPMGIEESSEQKQVYIMVHTAIMLYELLFFQDIDYEEFVYDLIEKQSEKMPFLQKLTIRKSLKNEQHDQRKSTKLFITIHA